MSAADVSPAPVIRIKVVHLVTLLELGGAQGNTIHTVRHLDPNRFDARLWCGRGGFWDSDVEADLGPAGRLRFIRHLVRPVRPLQDLLALLELCRAFRREKPDVVHTHSSKAGILGRFAAKLAGVPVILHTFHGFGFNDRQSFAARWIYLFLERRAARVSDRLIFVSASNRQMAQRLRIGDSGRYELIRSGVPLRRLAEVKSSTDRIAVRRSFGVPEHAPLVITISAFKPQKNLVDFMEMSRLVARDVPEAHFVLIGDGKQRTALEALAAEKGLSGRVHMPGWIQDPAALLAASNVFVLTSLWEGLPRALVESMSLGVPAVCYRTDGVADLLTSPDEVRPRGDVAGLAGSVARLLKDSGLALQLAAAQSGRVTSEYDIVEMVRRQEKLCLDVVRQTR